MGNSTLTDMTLLPGVDPIVAGLAAGSSSSPGQDGKAKKKPMKSLYLKFFDTAPDGKSRICRLCGKSYCMTTATGKCLVWFQHALTCPLPPAPAL